MKLAVKIVAPVVALLAAATTAVAVADPIDPTTPYPVVPANADVCKVEKLEITKQQTLYDRARRAYVRTRDAFRQGVASPGTFRTAERKLHEAQIKLNEAKYAEAACRNREGNAADRICVGLVLELHRLRDELTLRREIERVARDELTYVRQLHQAGSVSDDDLDQAQTDLTVAEIDRQKTEQAIADQENKIRNTPACNGFPVERPQVAPPPRPVPPPAPEPGEPTSTTTTPVVEEG